MKGAPWALLLPLFDGQPMACVKESRGVCPASRAATASPRSPLVWSVLAQRDIQVVDPAAVMHPAQVSSTKTLSTWRRGRPPPHGPAAAKHLQVSANLRCLAGRRPLERLQPIPLSSAAVHSLWSALRKYAVLADGTEWRQEHHHLPQRVTEAELALRRAPSPWTWSGCRGTGLQEAP